MFSTAVVAACAPRDPVSIAKAADARSGSGAYTWLAEHDPSALVTVGLDAATVRAVAPDARVTLAASVRDGCRLALVRHALLGVLVRAGTADRDRADDCGFALFRDDTALVIAPR